MSALYADLPGALSTLDGRATGYRFDLEADLPWHRAEESGLFITPAFVCDLGLDANALQARPEAWELFQWAHALQICEGFILGEEDLLSFLRGVDRAGLMARRSNRLLCDEEVKHIAMFRRYAQVLREARPLWAICFDSSFAWSLREGRLIDLLQEVTDSRLQHLFFWTATLLFEERTIYVHSRLGDPVQGDQVQPCWAALHREHMREEVQHVLTDLAHLRALQPSREELDRNAYLARRLVDEMFEVNFGLVLPEHLVAERFPGLDIRRERDVTRTPVYAAITEHDPIFRRTRSLLRGEPPWRTAAREERP